MFCLKCGNKLPDDAKRCDNCGYPIGGDPDHQPEKDKIPEQTPVTSGSIQTKTNQAAAAVLQVRTPLPYLSEQIAASLPGEAAVGIFGGAPDTVTGITEILNPFKTVLSGLKSFGQSFTGLFKSKQPGRLIIAGAIAVVWIVLMILSYSGINLGPLNWLTFALGGMGRGFFGFIGGLLGKTTVAAMFFSLLSGGYKHLGDGFKALLQSSNFKTNNLGVLLLGAGGALALYQFFAGNAFWTDTMSALSGALLSVQALGRGNGFLYTLAQSLTAKSSGKTRIAQSEKSVSLLTGVTYGFTLGALVSVTPFGILPVILGAACITAGIVLTVVFGNRKEAAA